MQPLFFKQMLLGAFFTIPSFLNGHYENYPPPRKLVVNSTLTLNTQSPADCSVNLAEDYLFSLSDTATKDFYYYNEDEPDTLKDVLYRDEEEIDISYEKGCVDLDAFSGNRCQATDKHEDDRYTLRYRVYYPKKTVHDYETTPLPLMVIFHAGGFSECSDYDDGGNENDKLAIMATEFARKGFICVLAHYRTGRIKDGATKYTSTSQSFGAYRSIQDAKGLLRSIVKRDAVNGHGNPGGSGGYRFKINTSQIFIGGLSAGGIAALGAAYYRNQNQINKVFPEAGNSDMDIEAAMSPLIASQYYENNVNAATPVIRGVLSCWSGFAIPKDDDDDEADFINGGGGLSNPPMIAFHGAADGIIKYPDDDDQDFYFSKDPPGKKEDYCLYTTGTFKIKKTEVKADVKVKLGSSYNMYHILDNVTGLNRFAELYEDTNAGHGIVLPASNYGLTSPTKDEIFMYIVQRAAVFFQAIMRWNLDVNANTFPPFGHQGDSYFADTTNTRICTP